MDGQKRQKEAVVFLSHRLVQHETVVVKARNMRVSVTVIFASRKLADVERWTYCLLIEDLVVMVVIKGMQRLLGNVARACRGGAPPAHNTRTKDKVTDLLVICRNIGVLVAKRIEFKKDECPRAVTKQNVRVCSFLGKKGIAQGLLARKRPGTTSFKASAKAVE
jgi:hypothetical protein